MVEGGYGGGCREGYIVDVVGRWIWWMLLGAGCGCYCFKGGYQLENGQRTPSACPAKITTITSSLLMDLFVAS